MAEVFGWVVKTLPKQTPGNALAKAIGYLAGIWPGLLVFLDNPAVPLDNNASERSMRGPVIGRKNHYGSRSKRGTEVAAQMYTILESCKLAGVNPAAYLRAAILAGMREESIALPHEWTAPPEPPPPLGDHLPMRAAPARAGRSRERTRLCSPKGTHPGGHRRASPLDQLAPCPHPWGLRPGGMAR